jgi:hypothetical protein
VTATDIGDAMAILRGAIFRGENLPEVEQITENVDISALDTDHVIPNMGNPLVRGIWFPAGFEVVRDIDTLAGSPPLRSD